MTPLPLPSTTAITYAQEYRRCGKATCRACQPDGSGHGPYWVARWTAQGSRHKQYLGRTPPPGVSAAPSVPLTPSSLSPLQMPAPTDTPPVDHPSGVWVQVLGDFAVWQQGRRIPDAAWRRRQAGTLVKCLLAAPAQRLRRDAVIASLWPDDDEGSGDPRQHMEAGRRNLRVSLHETRRLLDTQARPGADALAIAVEGNMLALVVRPVGHPEAAPRPPVEWLDMARFHWAARRALEGNDREACQAALALYRGPYLPDDLLLDERWVAQRIALWRHDTQQVCVAVHLHLAGLDQAADDHRAAEEHLRAVLQMDPAHEDAAASLMRLLVDSGRRGEALAVYRAVTAVPRRDGDVMPSAHLATLHAAILSRNPVESDASNGAGRLRLPQPYTPFIGRRVEQDEVCTVLSTTPLLTLTGIGGCGKSRLARAVVAAVAAAYADGASVVELAEVADPALVAYTVAEAVGLREEVGQPILTTLARGLRQRHLLLVLDNCEGQSAACARVVTRLLRECPTVRILATSREPLGLPAEMRYYVPPLALPTLGTVPLEQLVAYDAIALFVARVRAHRPDFQLTAQNAEVVRRICTALGGVALAIELAAAQSATRSPTGLAARLDDSLRLLVDAPPGSPARHQTLRATLDWGYALLTEAERLLLSRLSVFAGGCTVEAATAVCVGGRVRVGQVARLLSALADKSFVQIAMDTHPTRVTLLDTVRQYGAEQVAERGEGPTLRMRHRSWFADWMEGAEPALRGPEQRNWLDRVEAERDNLRRVLTSSGGDVDDLMDRAPGAAHVPAAPPDEGAEDAALRVAAALWRYWEMRAPLSEGRRWVESALAHADVTAPAYGQARVAAGRLAAAQRDDEAAEAHFRAALSVAKTRADDRVAALAFLGLAALALQRDDVPTAQAWSAESRRVWRLVGDPWGEASVRLVCGRAMHGRGRFEPLARASGVLEDAIVHYTEALSLWRHTGDRWGIAQASTALGDAAMDAEEYDDATAWYAEALILARDLGDDLGHATALFALGLVSYARNHMPAAANAFSQSARLAERIGARYAQAQALQFLADSADYDGLNGTAALYFRRSEELFREVGDELAAVHVSTGHAWLALTQGDAARAEHLAASYIARMHALGNSTNIVFGLYFLGGARLQRGNAWGAVAAHHQGLNLIQRQFRGWFRRHGTYVHLLGLGQALTDLGRLDVAARLLRAAERVNEPIRRRIHTWERPHYQRTLARLHDALGDASFDRLWAEGHNLTMDAAIAYGVLVNASSDDAAREETSGER